MHLLGDMTPPYHGFGELTSYDSVNAGELEPAPIIAESKDLSNVLSFTDDRDRDAETAKLVIGLVLVLV